MTNKLVPLRDMRTSNNRVFQVPGDRTLYSFEMISKGTAYAEKYAIEDGFLVDRGYTQVTFPDDTLVMPVVWVSTYHLADGTVVSWDPIKADECFHEESIEVATIEVK